MGESANFVENVPTLKTHRLALGVAVLDKLPLVVCSVLLYNLVLTNADIRSAHILPCRGFVRLKLRRIAREVVRKLRLVQHGVRPKIDVALPRVFLNDLCRSCHCADR